MRLDMCPHGVKDGCPECLAKRAVFEDKGAVLRVELAELRQEYQRVLGLNTTMSQRLGALLEERDELQARIFELEKQHETDADQFASGRRYEQSWGQVRETTLEDRVVDLENQLEFERDRRIAAERARFGKLEEEG